MRIHRREMALIFSGGVFIMALLSYLIIVSPALSRQKSLKKYITKKEADLVKMMELEEKWDRFNRVRVEIEKILKNRGKNFALLSFLEGITRKIGINRSIQYMKPLSSSETAGSFKTEGIEMKLDHIDIKQLVNFIFRIEYSGKLLNIKRIKIQRATKGKDPSLKVTLQVNTLTSS